MNGIIVRLYKWFSRGYLNRWIIFTLDILIGIISAVFSVLAVRYFIGLPEGFHQEYWMYALLFSLVGSVIAEFTSGIHKQIFRYTTLQVGWNLFLATLINMLITSFMLWGMVFLNTGDPYGKQKVLFGTFYALVFFLLAISFRAVMVMLVKVLQSHSPEVRKNKFRVLVYGVRDISVQAAAQLKNSADYMALGFVTKDEKVKNHEIDGMRIYYADGRNQLSALAISKSLDGVVFPAKNDFLKEREHFIQDCEAVGLETYLMPEVSQTKATAVATDSIRRVRIEDLLFREEIEHDKTSVHNLYRGKVVMVTGAAGSIGSELVRQIATFDVKQLILFEIAESPLHELRLSLSHRFPDLDFVPIIGDVRNSNRVEYVFRTYRPDIVLHAAAYKHVPLMEENPTESILTNLLGTKNVADMAVKYEAERMVMVSTDKAVNPTNVMGACKRSCEMYIQSLGKAIVDGTHSGRTMFITTRFGNVLGSQGSVIHLFRKQIAEGGPVTVTHPDIVRYFMSIPEACSLVLEASSMATKPQIFAFDMGQEHKIADLARRMIKLAGLEPDEDIQIKYTGLRPGEKLYEEVLSSEENTIPTDIEKVRMAVVRDNDFSEVSERFNHAIDAASNGDAMEAVRELKALVPEFISNNSEFSILDKKED